MLKTSGVIVLSALCLFAEPLRAQQAGPEGQTFPDQQAPGGLAPDRRAAIIPVDKHFSPSVSKTFYEIAGELAPQGPAAPPVLTKAEADQALMMLNAAAALNDRAQDVLADMLRIASRPSHLNRSQMIYDLLVKYVNKVSDLEVTDRAIRYLLEQLNSREQREVLLGRLIKELAPPNTPLSSELATLLGLLKAEKADDPNAIQLLAYAYRSDKYNRLAFEKLRELLPAPPGPTAQLEYLRLQLRKNPLALQAAMAFARYADKVQLYEVAADSYEYCAKLFEFHRPAEPLPDAIYLPLSLCCYNSPSFQHRCLQIAAQLRSEGRFDLRAEAVASKAALKMGDTEQANRILKTAENKAVLSALTGNQATNNTELAWFYCFAASQPETAIDWANKAYSADPSSPAAAAVLAYSLAKNGQTDLAQSLVAGYKRNQIATLTLALVQMAKGQNSTAVDTLKSAVDIDPGSLAAEEAKRILTRLNAEYVPLIDTAFVLNALHESIGEKIVPEFAAPRDIISLQLTLRGNKFSYGTDFGGSVAVTNNFSEPLVISDDALFTGYVTVDAKVTGDINREIPNLCSVRIRPSAAVEPGHSAVVPVRLKTGPLRKLLLSHPQASLNIEFTVYLDPVLTGEGEKVTGLAGIEPVTVTIQRPAVQISREFLRNRLNSLARGRQGQKIKTAQLFAGLLLEQHEMNPDNPAYKFIYADWMPDLLKSAMIHSLTDDDWVVRVHTMNAIRPLPLDYELIDAVSTSLNSEDWPARMMALYLLAKKQGDTFQKVLDYSVQYDRSEHVRNMALALGAARPVMPNAAEQQPAGQNAQQKTSQN